MVILFNNCRRRDHTRKFGFAAFYDLNRTGKQATMAANLKRGDECVVATPGKGRDIVFSWFSYSREEVRPAEGGIGVRVLFGKCLRSETLSRADAVATEPYSEFFDVNGNFKRRSVI